MFRPYQLYERIGTHFTSNLVQVSDDSEGVNGFTKHLEYHAMMNGRTHALGPDNNIMNQNFKKTYDQFLTTKIQKPGMSFEEKMIFVYYLQLQDRIAEATKLFNTIPEPPK